MHDSPEAVKELIGALAGVVASYGYVRGAACGVDSWHLVSTDKSWEAEARKALRKWHTDVDSALAAAAGAAPFTDNESTPAIERYSTCLRSDLLTVRRAIPYPETYRPTTRLCTDDDLKASDAVIKQLNDRIDELHSIAEVRSDPTMPTRRGDGDKRAEPRKRRSSPSMSLADFGRALTMDPRVFKRKAQSDWGLRAENPESRKTLYTIDYNLVNDDGVEQRIEDFDPTAVRKARRARRASRQKY